MKHIIVIIFFLFFFQYSSFSQISTTKLKDLKYDTDKNISVKKIFSDQNATVFIINIKKFVKKHFHESHTETVTIIDGRALMSLNNETFIVKKGDHIIIPPKTPHSVFVKGNKPLKVLSVQSPEFSGKDRIYLEN